MGEKVCNHCYVEHIFSLYYAADIFDYLIKIVTCSRHDIADKLFTWVLNKNRYHLLENSMKIYSSLKELLSAIFQQYHGCFTRCQPTLTKSSIIYTKWVPDPHKNIFFFS
jgi:hypothetical protein